MSYSGINFLDDTSAHILYQFECGIDFLPILDTTETNTDTGHGVTEKWPLTADYGLFSRNEFSDSSRTDHCSFGLFQGMQDLGDVWCLKVFDDKSSCRSVIFFCFDKRISGNVKTLLMVQISELFKLLQMLLYK